MRLLAIEQTRSPQGKRRLRFDRGEAMLVLPAVGADLSLLATFMAMGIDELSVTPTAVLPLRQEIRNTDTRTCDLSALRS